MIADELSQDDIDALLGGLGDDSGAEEDPLSALMGDDDDAGSSANEPQAPSLGGSSTAADTIELPEFAPTTSGETSQNMESLLSNVNLNVKVRLGRTEMLIEDLLRLQPGRVVQLDTMSGEPVDILVNNRVVAKGEVIILNEAFCVRISEIYDTINKLDRQG
jgi:flagellar motor switch protein FliN/FliY